MQKLTAISFVFMLSIALAGCFDSSSEESPPPAIDPPPQGVAADGQTYYQSNCADCHKAGTHDTTNAFGAVDLAQKQDMIQTDMSAYDMTSGYGLMLSFSNIPAQRVADLKAYLASVPQI